MGAVAVFDPVAFAARYPEFGSVSAPLLTDYFTEATLYLANDGTGPVSDASQQALLLNMLTAHIASLNSGVNGQAASPLVGRISSATEGSVSVSTDLSGVPGSAAWFAQSKYGLAYYQATSQYRTMRYIPGGCFSRGFPGYGYGRF